MKLEPFIARRVQPGEPLTAQAWNDIVQGISALYTHLESTAATSVRVALTNTDLDPAGVRVTATRDDGLSYEAVRPVPPITEYVFAGLPAGAYTVRAAAAGFDAASAAVSVPGAGVVGLTLTPRGAFMPSVFGLSLQGALGTLRDTGIAVSRVLDVTGRDVPPARPGPEYSDAPVLAQLPEPGAVIPPEGGAQLVVATALVVEPTLEVPSLAGLTLAEAQKALEGMGLVLGKVVTKQKRNL